ncbi:hypothetical protein PPERSA_10904 [Pseudocohnilembus persalinus]|uniref:Transmembrane protein n=1 Tax=Pseudocohnilembus persalinus TaxID=266149 RepID=A0A0V0R9H3_PSEPJ|nr:hypothetical protein PPERSA_10904 [Pseudocohnilembus persalinus]|eukprot:KRX11137.1 hypothetical protein PPERSA_10904 [Pseudocohnilembus persalinus]
MIQEMSKKEQKNESQILNKKKINFLPAIRKEIFVDSQGQSGFKLSEYQIKKGLQQNNEKKNTFKKKMKFIVLTILILALYSVQGYNYQDMFDCQAKCTIPGEGYHAKAEAQRKQIDKCLLSSSNNSCQNWIKFLKQELPNEGVYGGNLNVDSLKDFNDCLTGCTDTMENEDIKTYTSCLVECGSQMLVFSALVVLLLSVVLL